MTMNKILLILIVTSGFLLIFYANNDIFTRKRWSNMFQQDEGGGGGATSGGLDQQQLARQVPHHSTSGGVQFRQANSAGGGIRHRTATKAALRYEDLQPVRYSPSASPADEHNIFVIYTKENDMLRTKFELFMQSLLKYSSVAQLHLHVISDAHSEAAALDVMRKQILFYKHQTGRVRFSVYNVTECAERIADITAAMMPHFSVAGSHYADALFYVSLGLHRIVDPGMRRAILIDCDVSFRSDVSRLFEEFNRFSPDNLFGLSPELTPVYYHILYKFRERNPSTNFGRPYYPAAATASAAAQALNVDGSRAAHGNRKHSAASAAVVKHGYPGLNSGVVMLNLDAIRRSKLLENIIRPEHVARLVHKYQFRGHLGDQDFYTLIGYDMPGMVYRLDCAWNRQLCTWWKDHGYSEIFDTFFHCEGKIRLYHGNCNTRVPE